MHPRDVRMAFDIDQVSHLGSKLMGTLKILMPPKESVRVQDLRVILSGQLIFNMNRQSAYYGEPIEEKPFYHKTIQLMTNATIENDKTFALHFDLDEKHLETYDGNCINVRWKLEASFDPISFFGARQLKRQRVIVRAHESSEERKQSIICPIKTKRINLFVKFDNIQCSVSQPLTGQFVVESTNSKLKRKTVVI